MSTIPGVATMIIRKSKTEIEKMRAAGLIVAQVLKRLEEIVEPGMTTRELDREAETMIQGAGAYPTFKGITATLDLHFDHDEWARDPGTATARRR